MHGESVRIACAMRKWAVTLVPAPACSAWTARGGNRAELERPGSVRHPMGVWLAVVVALRMLISTQVTAAADDCSMPSIVSGRLRACLSADGAQLQSLSVDGGDWVPVSTSAGLRAPSNNVTVRQRFSAAADDAIRWEVEITSSARQLWGVSSSADGAYSTLSLANGSHPSLTQPSFWTGYGAWPPPSTAGFFEPFSLRDLFAVATDKGGQQSAFLRMGCTPRGPTGLNNFLCDASDGSGTGTASFNNGPPQWPLPLFSFTKFGSSGGSSYGLSVIAAPNDTLVNSALQIESGSGGIHSFSILNWNHRLGVNTTIKLTRFIVVHDGCWRPGLRWLARKFASFFEPHHNSGFQQLWGSGQYMDYRGNVGMDETWRLLNLTMNWDATFPWPWWGNYMPSQPEWQDCIPVGHGAPATQTVEPWNRKYGKNVHWTKDWKCEAMNHTAVARWYTQLKKRVGAGTVYYGNAFEFGSWTIDPDLPLHGCDPPPPLGSGNHSAYCESNAQLRRMVDAAVRTSDGSIHILEETRGSASPCNPQPDGCRPRIAPGMMLLDPGVLSAQRWLLQVLKNQMKYTPGAGLAMDRQDHCVGFSPGGDDNVSWDAANGGKTSHLAQGWKQMMALFAQELHAAGQALILSSTGNRRLDFSEHVDAFFDEIGDSPGSFAVNGLLAIHAPLVTWCHNYVGNFTSSEPATGLSNVWNCGAACFDRFLMMHLLVGSMPTVPSPWGDHTNPTNPQTDGHYLDFAPLFAFLQGKRWVLEPRVVATNETSVWANVFTNIRNEIVVPLSFQSINDGHSHPRKGCVAAPGTNHTAIGGNNLVNLQLSLGAHPEACAVSCCSTTGCSGWTFQPTTIAHNGVCVKGPRPCCWLKSNTSEVPIKLTNSSLPGIVSGFVRATLVPPPPPPPVDVVAVTLRLPFNVNGTTAFAVWPGLPRGSVALSVGLHQNGTTELSAALPLRRGSALLVLEGASVSTFAHATRRLKTCDGSDTAITSFNA